MALKALAIPFSLLECNLREPGSRPRTIWLSCILFCLAVDLDPAFCVSTFAAVETVLLGEVVNWKS